jgi:hypothetical protein
MLPHNFLSLKRAKSPGEVELLGFSDFTRAGIFARAVSSIPGLKSSTLTPILLAIVAHA